MSDSEETEEILRINARKILCEDELLYFTQYFFKIRHGIKFKLNWHHTYMSDKLQDVVDGKIQNLIITVPPGSTKTELAVINFMAYGLAKNPRSRFLHLSGSDSLASLNSSAAREIIRSDEFQEMWPLEIADDADAKKRWNVLVDNQKIGGVYATSLGGQITGFRAGHMTEDFQGAIIIDDPIKPEDAYSKIKLDAANRKLISTVKSRKANPKTPIVIIMQRIAENDPVGFIESGNLDGQWTKITIPAVIDESYIAGLDPRYRELIEPTTDIVDGRRSYWGYKEPLKELLSMERGDGADQTGAKISRYVFSAQYQQAPTALGGNIIKGEYFERYTELPKIKYRKIYADTAQKTKEQNDYSVFECWGHGVDNKIYLIDMIRGKWEAPELQKRAIAFWQKHKGLDIDKHGQLRKMVVEDKSSGTGLVQTLKLPPHNIQIEAIERAKDKLTRVMDALPYLESRQVCVPENAPFTNDFIAENEAFTPDDSHDFDDQVDPMVDAIMDMLGQGNKLKVWAQLAENSGRA
jgi:predicted phage terminase large subunit-like protein